MAQGSSGNPGDKPYQVLTLDPDDDKATAQLQAARNAGLELEGFAATDGIWRVILGNYKGN